MTKSESDYSEFENLDEMDQSEQIIYLGNIINRYSEVIAIAKQKMQDLIPYATTTSTNEYTVKHRASLSVDNNMLFTSYPEVYESLYLQGKLVAKASDLKDTEAYDNVVTAKDTAWIEVKKG